MTNAQIVALAEKNDVEELSKICLFRELYKVSQTTAIVIRQRENIWELKLVAIAQRKKSLKQLPERGLMLNFSNTSAPK